MKAAWQTFTSAISEGFAGVGVAAQKMKVYLDWAKSGNPFSYKYQQAKIADIDAQAAKEKTARKQQDDEAMAGIFNETTARIQGTVAATQAELDAQRARQRFGKRMRENLLAGEMAALDASTNEALNAAEANLANAQGELAASVAAARSKAVAAAGDNTRGAGLPEMPAPGDLAAAAAGAGAKGSVAGSFSALALAGMGNRNAADRTAKATEESAGHLRKIVKGQKANRFVFTGDASPVYRYRLPSPAMAINIDERFISREQTDGEQRSAELIYLAECTDGENELEAKYAVLAYCPAVYDAMVPDASHVEAINATMYEVAITYGPPKRAEPNMPTWSFDTTGGTRKVTQAVAHIGDYAPPGQTAPNFGGAIGVTPDGNVEGVEVPAPSGKYSEHWVLSRLWVSDAYLMTLAGMTGSVNATPFRGRNPGEVMFMGARASSRDQDWVEIDFEFNLSPNAFNVPVGNITVPFKRGWDYVWTRYVDDEDATAKVAIKTAASAHLDQVATYSNFALLGIGL